MRITLALGVIVMFAMPPHAFASFMMFCELKGDVVSPPVRSEDVLEFEFVVRAAMDITITEAAQGNADCHVLEGERLTIILGVEDSGDPASIKMGAGLTLERYDIDAYSESGAIVRSIKYVRSESQKDTAPANER